MFIFVIYKLYCTICKTYQKKIIVLKSKTIDFNNIKDKIKLRKSIGSVDKNIYTLKHFFISQVLLDL